MTMKLEPHKVVSQEEWTTARKALLKKEKESTELLDQLAAERRKLPWVKITKDYVFDAPGGARVKLADLFGSHSQLVVYHFMFGPKWKEGCPSCSYVSDHNNATPLHLGARDVSFVSISHAPIEKLEAFKKRMGWKFQWVSAYHTDFNQDFHVSFSKEETARGKVVYNYEEVEFPGEAEAPGLSVFFKNEAGEIFHTYSTYGRGLDLLLGTYRILDMVPKGRDEKDLPFGMAWVRYHDRYEGSGQKFADADMPYWPVSSPDELGATDCGCACGSASAKKPKEEVLA